MECTQIGFEIDLSRFVTYLQQFPGYAKPQESRLRMIKDFALGLGFKE